MILLREKYGYGNVVPVLLDVGQGDVEIEIARERAEQLGVELIFFDARDVFTKEYIFRCSAREKT